MVRYVRVRVLLLGNTMDESQATESQTHPRHRAVGNRRANRIKRNGAAALVDLTASGPKLLLPSQPVSACLCLSLPASACPGRFAHRASLAPRSPLSAPQAQPARITPSMQ